MITYDNGYLYINYSYNYDKLLYISCLSGISYFNESTSLTLSFK